MIDSKAMAYVNMYGVLGALQNLCELDPAARTLVRGLSKTIAPCFMVKNGPCCTFHFSHDGCTVTDGSVGCTCKMEFASPEKFNQMITSGKPGMPVKGVVPLLRFLTGSFTQLTNRLTEVLRPSAQALRDPDFFEENTLMTMYVIAGAISGLANYDPIGRISADNTVDGDVLLGIRDRLYVTIRVKDHRFTTIRSKSETPRAIMEFDSVALAHDLFNGTASTVNEMCQGHIHLAGMLSMVDNVNRILDRVSLYLA